MFNYYKSFLFILSTTATCIVSAQINTSEYTAGTLATKECAAIPGKTMGQKMESLLFWSQAEKERRFPQMYRIFPSLQVQTGDKVFPLKKGRDIRNLLPADYLKKYVTDNHITGIVVLQNGKVQLEVYGAESNRQTKWTSFSVAKSVTSMLLGAALKDGSVKSLDDPLSKYIAALQNVDYGKVTVRQLLTMTSGIAWNEDYADENSDVASMYRQPCIGKEAHIVSYMKNLPAAHEPGTVWNYSTGETDLLGILIEEATGKSLASYLSEKIWKPWGMESSAFWLADECSGGNFGGSGLSATVRDFARLGTVMLFRDENGHHPFFADEYVQNAVSLLQPTGTGGSGYGYLWWRNADGSYAAFGIFGQMIYINPKTNVVIAQIAAWPSAGSRELSAKRSEFIKAVEKALQ
ncbi:serine hydrolase domain-containing protein [Kaistella palustris]|uniref:serine hydrolase domain-containing protein n=1 Tax=Kaistella palustris TaxID=493376 RepID=UPI000486E9A3|nr:serine hydrolase [Kaistella palustris]